MRKRCFSGVAVRWCGVLATAFFAAATTVAQQPLSYISIHNFGGPVENSKGQVFQDGIAPYSPVTFDSAGNMYGVTFEGGPLSTGIFFGFGGGIVWEITTSGEYLDLHDFGGYVTDTFGDIVNDGTDPTGQVSIDAAGNIYGIASFGGANDLGMIWEISKDGAYSDLHDFGGTILNTNGQFGSDGYFPECSPTLDSQGNLYGTASSGGGLGGGLIWKVTPSGAYFDLHDFGGTIKNAGGKSGRDGVSPGSNLALDASGNLYGVAFAGRPNGTGGDGILWKLSSTGSYSDLHDFGNAVLNVAGQPARDGRYPVGLTLDLQGNIYGATESGGPNELGVLWKLSKTGSYRDLHDFGNQVALSDGSVGIDGAVPSAGVTLDSKGDVFGVTGYGGKYDPNLFGFGGILFEVTASGEYKDLHDFGGGTMTYSNGSVGPDGYAVYSSLALDKEGNIYGSAEAGGPFGNDVGGDGVLFKFSSTSPVGLKLSSTKSAGGDQVAGQVTLANPAPFGGTILYVESDVASLKVPSSIKIPAGSTSGTFSVSSVPVTEAYSGKISVRLGKYTESSALTIEPFALESVSVSPSTVFGSSSASVTGTVTLSGPPPSGGATVTLSSSDPTIVQVPGGVPVHSGHSTATFAVKHSAVTKSTKVTITASYGSVTSTTTVTVSP
jgi:hypothetical protein